MLPTDLSKKFQTGLDFLHIALFSKVKSKNTQISENKRFIIG